MFVWSGVIGTLILLVVYFMATIGAIRLLLFSGEAKVPMWQIVIPLGASRAGLHALPQRVAVPGDAQRRRHDNASFFLPIICGIWILLAILLVVVRPGWRGGPARSSRPTRGSRLDRSPRGEAGGPGRARVRGSGRGAAAGRPPRPRRAPGRVRSRGVRASDHRVRPRPRAGDLDVRLADRVRDPPVVRAGARPGAARRPRQYLARARELGPEETNRRLLGPSGVRAT